MARVEEGGVEERGGAEEVGSESEGESGGHWNFFFGFLGKVTENESGKIWRMGLRVLDYQPP